MKALVLFAQIQPIESSLAGQNSPARPSMSFAEVGPVVDYFSEDFQHEVDRPLELGSSENQVTSPELSCKSQDRGSSMPQHVAYSPHKTTRIGGGLSMGIQ